MCMNFIDTKMHGTTIKIKNYSFMLVKDASVDETVNRQNLGKSKRK